MKLSLTLKNISFLFVACLLGVITYQAMGGITLDSTNTVYNIFPTLVRCGVIGLFIGFSRKDDEVPFLGILIALLVVCVGALLTYKFSPIGTVVFNYNLGIHVAIEPLLAACFSLLGWYLAHHVRNKTLHIILPIIALAAIAIGFIGSASFYAKPYTVGYKITHTRTRLSDLKYDGFDYAETINRMNFNHQGYYQAYKDAWSGDSRVQPFTSIMFFRPSGMPTLLALLPGKTLFSVFLWWGILLGLCSFASYMITLKYCDESYAFISSILVGFTLLALGASNLIAFNWLFAEIPAAMVLLCAFAFSLYKKWWPAALCFILACATREFSIMFLPFPFLILIFQNRDEKKKGIVPLLIMIAGVLGFYIMHYFLAPVADAHTGTKMNFINTWFHGSFAYYSNYLTYRINDSWALSNFMILLPFASLLAALCVKPLGDKIALAYIPATLGLFYLFMGQNEYQGYWGGFGLPLLIACLALFSAFACTKNESPEGPSSIQL